MLEYNYFSTSAFEFSYENLEQKVDHFIELITKISKQEETTKLSTVKDIRLTCSILFHSSTKK